MSPQNRVTDKCSVAVIIHVTKIGYLDTSFFDLLFSS